MKADHSILHQLQSAGIKVEESALRYIAGQSYSPETAADYLISLGLGRYDEQNQWQPLSDKVYAFDAEIDDVEHMYTDFLQRIQTIIPGFVAADISEDLSGMTGEVDDSAEPWTDGKRSFSFRCNGHAYTCELDSQCDWFNPEAFTFLKNVLKKEGFSGNLGIINMMEIQGALVTYGSKEQLMAISALLGIHEDETMP